MRNQQVISPVLPVRKPDIVIIQRLVIGGVLINGFQIAEGEI
jgi:hypothetical protein